MQGEAVSQLRLPAVLDLGASEAFLDTMRHAAEAETLKVDASAVDVLTLPCMQIILAALKAYPGMTIEKPSEAFVRAFADLALDWRQDGQAEPGGCPRGGRGGRSRAGNALGGGPGSRRNRKLHKSRYSNGRGLHDQANPDHRQFKNHT